MWRTACWHLNLPDLLLSDLSTDLCGGGVHQHADRPIGQLGIGGVHAIRQPSIDAVGLRDRDFWNRLPDCVVCVSRQLGMGSKLRVVCHPSRGAPVCWSFLPSDAGRYHPPRPWRLRRKIDPRSSHRWPRRDHQSGRGEALASWRGSRRRTPTLSQGVRAP